MLINISISNNMVHEYFDEMKKVHNEMMTKLKSGLHNCENGEFEFASDEGKYRSPQKRKHNILDF